jgi:uncharacterized protein YcbK (DUF882 family)
MRGIHLTDHFQLHEFACKGTDCACHGAVKFDWDVVRALEEFRVATGHPLIITSAFRCDAHNVVVGGHPQSFHRVGMAVDVTSWLVRKDLAKWAKIAAEIIEGRLGHARGNVIWYEKKQFIHLDGGHRIAELVRQKEKM